MKMRIRSILTTGLLLVLLGTNGVAQDLAEKDPRPGSFPGYNLTDEQIERMQEIRTESEKILLPMERSLRTREAELDELLIAEKPDLKSIERKIEEIEALRAKIRKERIASRLETRSLLTDEQRLRWDAYRGGRFGRGVFRSGRFDGRGLNRGFGRAASRSRRFGGRGFYRSDGLGPYGYGMGLNRRDRFRDFRARRFFWRDNLPDGEAVPEMEEL